MHRYLMLVLGLLCFSTKSLLAGSFFNLLPDLGGEAAIPVSLSVTLDSLHQYATQPQPASLSFQDVDGNEREWSLKIEVRGKYRRAYCDWVPLRINLPKKALRAAGLASFDKYKLVVPCYGDTASRAELIKEYMAYRTYNLLTPQSYQVRLLSITYQDPRGLQPDYVAPAIIIESNAELAIRLGGTIQETEDVFPGKFIPAGEATNALFQYLIGNKDWGLAMNHNIIFFRENDGRLLPIPFDFDFSGWVKASYARPNPRMGQTTLEQRIYLGYAQSDSLLLRVMDTFQLKREAVLANLKTDLLSPYERRRLSQYVDSFYTIIEELRTVRKNKYLYDRLRGKDAEIIPSGEEPQYFQYTEK